MAWLNEGKGVVGATEQIEPVYEGGELVTGTLNKHTGVFERSTDGIDILHISTPGQEQVADDDPRVLAILRPPDPPPLVSPAEIVEALDEVAAGLPAAGRVKLDALKDRLIGAL